MAPPMNRGTLGLALELTRPWSTAAHLQILAVSYRFHGVQLVVGANEGAQQGAAGEVAELADPVVADVQSVQVADLLQARYFAQVVVLDKPATYGGPGNSSGYSLSS
eukprot:1151186-Pelagomonas_calceolata.AAC.20